MSSVQDFKIGDRVEFAYNIEFDKYCGSTNPNYYDTGTVKEVLEDNSYKVQWDSDNEITIPYNSHIRLLSDNRRPHADLIIAWANGSDIQWYKEISGEWEDVPQPMWHQQIKYRIKPKIVKVNLKLNPGNRVIVENDNPNIEVEFDSHGTLISVSKISVDKD